MVHLISGIDSVCNKLGQGLFECWAQGFNVCMRELGIYCWTSRQPTTGFVGMTGAEADLWVHQVSTLRTQGQNCGTGQVAEAVRLQAEDRDGMKIRHPVETAENPVACIVHCGFKGAFVKGHEVR